MPVFDFSSDSKKETAAAPKATYEVYASNARRADADHPIMVLDQAAGRLQDHCSGSFQNPIAGTAFAGDDEQGSFTADILRIDGRFVSLVKWLGENHIVVKLTGTVVEVTDTAGQTKKGFAVYKVQETGVAVRGAKLSGENGFLQFMMERLFASDASDEKIAADDGTSDIEDMDDADSMRITSIQSITDYLTCAGSTLPDNIRLWARRNLAVAKSGEVTPEERRHAQRALSMMLGIQWKTDYFEAIDPVEAKRILDEELYGMEKVKQRVIETIIQINRTHTLPSYGILLIGPAGIGKSQLAYAIARILKMSWTTLEMSSINDPEQLTGSSRIYANAKPGLIMEAFSNAGSSNLVFIINELDKAAAGKGNGNPADVLLTLFDNLGFTDNYIECNIPTAGVYPIATANDRSAISAPLMSRFAVIELPDYTFEEKKQIFANYVFPKVLKKMGMKAEECIITDKALDALIDAYRNASGVRDLEQAAEHVAANALYRIETEQADSVKYTSVMIKELLK